MSLESQIGYRRSLKIFLNHFQKNVIFRLSALGRPKAEGKHRNDLWAEAKKCNFRKMKSIIQNPI